jgi:NADP-dependent 3-hydroxy acid dehydrogenase YdfG
MPEVALVTGASGGIGEDLARLADRIAGILNADR